MSKIDKKKLASEWADILKNHPSFARSFLAQQAILMDAAELGSMVVDKGMCLLLKSGLPVLFEKYWISRCKQKVIKHIEIGGIIGCLSETNRDPARCFANEDQDGWFDDPFAGGQVLPPLPPDPHIR
ncbi:MAG: hypothetical protein GXO77_05835 [Calditrichaeota bacterium]|nr:hypothetical protein [Calditrichota bacterium]